MAVSENPYRRQTWSVSRCRRQTLVTIVVGLLQSVLVVILHRRWNQDPFRCNHIHSLFAKVRQEHAPRWEIRHDQDGVGEKSGGVALFVHLAKTGGSTVRGNFASSYNQVEFRPLLKQSDWNRVVPQMERRLVTHNNKRILFIELHGQGSFPNAEQWPDILQKWRSLADFHQKHFFVFTIIREPLSHAVSYYNFFHKNQVNATEAMLMEHLVANRQCTTLSRYKSSWWSSYQGVTDSRVCTELYKNLLQHFDWIGTTEHLDNETLPLLHQLLTMWTNETGTLKQEFSSYNVGKSASIHGSNLSDSTVAYIRKRTCLDRALWEQVQRDFPIQQVLQHHYNLL